MRFWLWALLFASVATTSFAADQLIIISPHRKSIQEEFVPAFQEYYKKNFKTEVKVDWLDQGGTSDDIRFVKAKYDKNPKSAGIDLFWGGGTATFIDLNQAKVLERFTPEVVKTKDMPQTAAGVPLYDKSGTWYATAMSSFGIFYNKKILQMDKLPEPKLWSDLANPALQNNISLTDPRRSGTANTMNTIVLASMGWDKGWEMLTAIGANTKSFTHSSSDPIKSVVSGDTAYAMAIDFYALAKIGDLGANNLGFVLPQGQTVLDPDPIAILKGAPNRKVAERFVDFVLSKEEQIKLMVPKGTPGGPKFSSLGRMAVTTKAYAATEGKRLNPLNPFKEKGFVTFNMDQAAKEKAIFNDLVGALIIDTHGELRKAWKEIAKNGVTPEELAAMGKPPVTQKEFEKMAEKWNDNVFRNKTINSWVDFAKKKYQLSAH